MNEQLLILASSVYARGRAICPECLLCPADGRKHCPACRVPLIKLTGVYICASCTQLLPGSPYARKLCWPCYKAADQEGRLGEWPSARSGRRSREEIALRHEEYAFFRDGGMTRDEAARRVGITPNTAVKNYERRYQENKRRRTPARTRCA